jgi:hypothetical protein
MDDAIFQVVAECCRTVLMDEPWAHVVAGVVRPTEVGRLAEAYITTGELSSTLGFASAGEAKRRLNDAIVLYVETPADRWPTLLMSRIDPTAAHLGLNARTMVEVLKQPMT